MSSINFQDVNRTGNSAMSDILNPINGQRGRLKNQGRSLKNHIKDNHIKIKEKEKENRIKRNASMVLTQPFKLKRYKNVDSKLNFKTDDILNNNSLPKRSNSACSSINVKPLNEANLNLHTKQAGECKMQNKDYQESIQDIPLNKYKQPRIQTHEVIFEEAIDNNRKDKYNTAPSTCNMEMFNYNKNKYKNKNIIKTDRPPKAPKQINDLSSEYKSYGKVPKQLEKRNKDQEEKLKKEKEQQESRKDCPEGHIKLSEEERIKTLNELKHRKEEIDKMICLCPINPQSISAIRRKDELYKKIDEIDKAVEVFSKKVVYIEDK